MAAHSNSFVALSFFWLNLVSNFQHDLTMVPGDKVSFRAARGPANFHGILCANS